MSEYGHCPVGGQKGIRVTRKEQVEYTAKLGKKCIDEIIPLPHGNKENKNCKHENEIYWENEEGSHGWCCHVCGIVTQWG